MMQRMELALFLQAGYSMPESSKEKSSKIKISISLKYTNVICVSKIVVGSFRNQWRDKISEICGCKTMDDFVKYD